MDEALLRKIQLAELDMLKIVIDIFESNNIRYYLSGGTVLGAVRHQGFIPWDDDIDIMVPRKDYDKLECIFNRYLPKHLVFQNCGNCTHFPYVFSRVMLRGTALVFQGTEHLYFHHGVHIDIQPLDTVPNGWKFNILMFAMRMAKMLLNIRYLSPYKNGKKRPLVKRIIIYLVAMTISREAAHKICNKLMTMYQGHDLEHVACLGGIYGKKECFPKWVLGRGTQLKFEDSYFNGPEKYDIYLRQLYGNYMEVPDEDKKQHHQVIYASLTGEFRPQ